MNSTDTISPPPTKAFFEVGIPQASQKQMYLTKNLMFAILSERQNKSNTQG